MGTPSDYRTRKAETGAAMTQERVPAALSGPSLRELFADARGLLERHVQALNAINVYPVPDGDTGTNMHLTLRAGVDEMERTSGDDASVAARALAEGALMGARGNSGVILSQVLRGFASGLDCRAEADGAALAEGLSEASRAAYAALSEPVEGTILTVAREAAQAAAAGSKETAEAVLSSAVDAANRAVERTPELLPVLREAGVVDAGALGLAIVLEGLLRSLRGDPLDVDLAPDAQVGAGWRVEATSLHGADDGASGYCTEFVVSGQTLDAEATRAHMRSLGGSVLVVDGEDMLRVHLHTDRPDDAFAYGRSLGELSHTKVDNLGEQIQQFVSAGRATQPITAGIGIVAVVAGDGIAAAFRSVGAVHIVEGGQTMNPSAGEILEAIESCAESEVAVLPNNKNIIAAAQQAGERASKHVVVISSRSIPQGIAAVLALNSDATLDENEQAMDRALGSVRSAEVTRAVRATTIEGKRIEVGQPIGVIDGSLQVVADEVVAAAEACVERMMSSEASLLTIYVGQDARSEEAESLAQALRTKYAKLEVDLVAGGQPHYPYIISLE